MRSADAGSWDASLDEQVVSTYVIKDGHATEHYGIRLAFTKLKGLEVGHRNAQLVGGLLAVEPLMLPSTAIGVPVLTHAAFLQNEL